ncbi:MAG TPA: hypothetical protein DDW31_03810, partial [candidate division Zixibacteria bacterium]|nr:hypothetical protein [candidate division Zixibacteria bacterium]
EMGSKSGLTVVINNMGNVHNARGEHRQALDCYRQALETAEGMGERKSIGTYHCNMGLCHVQLGDRREALECYRRGTAILREMGLGYELCYHLYDYAQLQFDLGMADQAVETAEQAAGMAYEAGRGDVLFDVRVLKGRMAYAGDRTTGTAELEALAEDTDDPGKKAEVYLELHKLDGNPRFREKARNVLEESCRSTKSEDARKRLDEIDKPASRRE